MTAVRGLIIFLASEIGVQRSCTRRSRPGLANRNLAVADLNVPDADGGDASGLHARVPRVLPAPAVVTAPPTSNLNVGLMAWDLALADLS